MLFEFFIVLIVVLAFLVTPYFQKGGADTPQKHSQIREKIEELQRFVDIVVNHIQLERAFAQGPPFLVPKYKLVPSERFTRTEMVESDSTSTHYIIHLVFWDQTNGRLYEDNALRYALLHELAHVVSPEGATHGSPVFEDIEDTLLETANKLGYYDPRIALPASYPCMIE